MDQPTEPPNPSPVPQTSPSAPPSLEPRPDKVPSHRHRRNGYVAQKPREVREKINRLLDNGLTFKKVIAALGDDGKDLTEDSMSSWYNGGFQDYLRTLDRKDALRSNHDNALAMLEEKAGTPVQDASRTIAANQLYELLLNFDPTSLAQTIADKPELYLRIINALSRLSEGEAVTIHRRAQESLISSSKLTAQNQPAGKNVPTEAQLKEITHEINLV